MSEQIRPQREYEAMVDRFKADHYRQNVEPLYQEALKAQAIETEAFSTHGYKKDNIPPRVRKAAARAWVMYFAALEGLSNAIVDFRWQHGKAANG